MEMRFVGFDDYDRAVYVDGDGKIWKDVDPRSGREPSFYTAYKNEFNGEPNTPMNVMGKYIGREITFIPKRYVW